MEGFLAYLRSLVKQDPGLALLLFSLLFVVKHSVCFPGGTLLNMIAGALWGPTIAIPLCATLSAIGGSACYLLSRRVGSPLLTRWRLESRVAPLRRRVEAAAARGSLSRLLVSMRLIPFVSQGVLNVIAPHAGIDLSLFAATTAVGLVPFCAATCSAGAALAGALDAGSSAVPTALPLNTLLALAALAGVVAFGPALMESVGTRLFASSSSGGGGGGAMGGGGLSTPVRSPRSCVVNVGEGVVEEEAGGDGKAGVPSVVMMLASPEAR